METLHIPLYLLAGMFFFVAMLYSSVGLGGGSSYTALMAIFGVSHVLIPGISLSLNLIVTFIGAINFIRSGHSRWSLILPFILSSVPMSYVGGLIPLPATWFYILLWISLIIVVYRIYFLKELKIRLHLSGKMRLVISLVIGSILGFLAGAVGIGGGIYLIPILIIFGFADEKEAAATGSIFIWVNSLAGVVARAQNGWIDPALFLPLLGSVAAGGFLGSRLGAFSLKPETMKKILSVVIIIAIVFLTKRITVQ